MTHDLLLCCVTRMEFPDQTTELLKSRAGKPVNAKPTHFLESGHRELYNVKILWVFGLKHREHQDHCSVESLLSHGPADQCRL